MARCTMAFCCSCLILCEIELIIVFSKGLSTSEPLESAILMNATWVEGVNNFLGYVAQPGSVLVITCNVSGGFGLMINNHELLPVSDGRIAISQNGGLLMAVIHNLTNDDTGMYQCGGDSKKLAVIAESPSLQNIDCISHNFDDLICEFSTRSESMDSVRWTIRWAAVNRMCRLGECLNEPCDNSDSITQGTGKLICLINGNLFVDSSYRYNITATSLVGRVPSFQYTVRLNSSILKMNRIEIDRHNMRITSLNVTLLWRLNYPTGSKIFFECLKYGVNYTASCYMLKDSDVKHIKEVSWTVKLLAGSVTFTDLRPYTEYRVCITSQLYIASAKGARSDPSCIDIQTLEDEPAVAPFSSPDGYRISDNCAISNQRAITVYWQPVQPVAGQGNGNITSYNLYDESDGRRLLDKVDGLTLRGRVCVDKHSEVRFCVYPANSAGEGKLGSCYVVPRQSSVPELAPCMLTAHINGTQVRVEWEEKETGSSYSLFWCEGSRSDCEPQSVLKTLRAESNSCGISLDLQNVHQLYDLHLGVSRTYNNYSSGIVWVSCINSADGQLLTATPTVAFSKTEATVGINSECVPTQRQPNFYQLHYCLVDSYSNVCVQPERTTVLAACHTKVTLQLDEHSSSYAFWLVSRSAYSVSVGPMVVEWTSSRELYDWEVALAVVFGLIFITLILLLTIHLHKQYINVIQFTKPKIVQPTQLDSYSENQRDCKISKYMDNKRCDFDSYSLLLTREQNPNVTLHLNTHPNMADKNEKSDILDVAVRAHGCNLPPIESLLPVKGTNYTLPKISPLLATTPYVSVSGYYGGKKDSLGDSGFEEEYGDRTSYSDPFLMCSEVMSDSSSSLEEAEAIMQTPFRYIQKTIPDVPIVMIPNDFESNCSRFGCEEEDNWNMSEILGGSNGDTSYKHWCSTTPEVTSNPPSCTASVSPPAVYGDLPLGYVTIPNLI